MNTKPKSERIEAILTALELLTPYMSIDVIKEWESSAHITLGYDPACDHIKRFLNAVIKFRRGD